MAVMEDYIFTKKEGKKPPELFFMWLSHTNLDISLVLEKVISMGVWICSEGSTLQENLIFFLNCLYIVIWIIGVFPRLFLESLLGHTQIKP